MKSINPVIASMFLFLAAVLIGILYVNFAHSTGERLTIEGYLILTADSKATATRDVLVLTITNEYPCPVKILEVKVETDTGATPPILPSLPIEIPPRATVSIVVGGDGKYWTIGKTYLVTIVYEFRGRQITSTAFTHG